MKFKLPEWIQNKLRWYRELRKRNVEYYKGFNKNSYTTNELIPFYVLFSSAWVSLILGFIFNVPECMVVWTVLIVLSLFIDPDDWNYLRSKPQRRKQKH
jgi:hypothetical protein